MIGDINKKGIYLRKLYFFKIEWYFQFPVIKVITWLRRVWKSYFLLSVLDYFIQNNLYNSDAIFYINKEYPEYDFLKNKEDLQAYFLDWVGKNKIELWKTKIVVAIDEIQDIQWWEKFINGYFAKYKESIEFFITGSNSSLISWELATFLSWRYVEIPIFSFSFNEYLEFLKKEKTTDNFIEYLKIWWIPAVLWIESEENTFWYLKSIYSTIFLQDIIKYHNIKNIDFFDRLYAFLFWNIWNIFSARSITQYLKSQKITLKLDTVLNYLKYGESSFLIYKIWSSDPKTKKYFEIYNKYYVGDLGLRNSLVWWNLWKDIWSLLENYVFLELKRNDYDIKIWRLKNNSEIDFIAEKKWIIKYIQVSYLLWTQATVDREYASLEAVLDNWEKYIVSMDTISFGVKNGIKHINILNLHEIL